MAYEDCMNSQRARMAFEVFLEVAKEHTPIAEQSACLAGDTDEPCAGQKGK